MSRSASAASSLPACMPFTAASLSCSSRAFFSRRSSIVSSTSFTSRVAASERRGMALGATIYHFTIRLSDVDRGVYETLELKAAKHPSESDDYLVTRVLAYCLEYAEGIAFSRGLSDPEEPAIAVRDLTGALRAWIEIGLPDAARLHKAAKAAPRVAVYPHKEPAQLLHSLQGERIHRAEALELYSLGRELVASLVKRLARRNDLDLSVADRHLYVTMGGETLSGEVERLLAA